MSEYDRVLWSEGMFLRPHHYQQYTRYLEDLVESRSEPLRPFSWGFTNLKIDQKLLGMGKFALSQASGVFQDGTPFDTYRKDDLPSALEIPEGIKETIVYLGVPLYRPGAPDVDFKANKESLARFAPHEVDLQDNTTVGGTPAAIQVGKLRTRFLLEKDSRDDYACMGIARIVEVKPDKSITLDSSYIPPVLNCQASSFLSGFIAELLGLLTHRAEALAGRVTMAGKGGAAEISDFLMLQLVNRYLPLLGHLTSLKGLHPEALFQHLLCLTGELATFTNVNKRVPDLEIYRHDQLDLSFRPLVETLRQSLSMVLEQTAVPLPLQERNYGIRVASLPDHSLLDQGMFVLSVSADVPDEQLRKRFPTQLKIGPVEQIRQLVNVQLPGIKIRPLPVAPRQIPFHTGCSYFELEKGGELWNQLKGAGGIAFHVGGDYPELKMELWAIRS